MKLDFSEIQNWREFEDLVESYFRKIQELKDTNIVDVKVEASGEGNDGGRDILVSFINNDSIVSYKRVWVIQCKFYERSVSKRELSDLNIPTLIHEYRADGYLLICKTGVSSKVSEMFENLRRNCRWAYHYEIWTGNIFKEKLLLRPEIISHYFPKYHRFISEKEGFI